MLKGESSTPYSMREILKKLSEEDVALMNRDILMFDPL